jgi:hypothetical protein
VVQHPTQLNSTLFAALKLPEKALRGQSIFIRAGGLERYSENVRRSTGRNLARPRQAAD